MGGSYSGAHGMSSDAIADLYRPLPPSTSVDRPQSSAFVGKDGPQRIIYIASYLGASQILKP